MEYTLDRMTADDWKQVREIYLEGIATRNATIETEAPDWDEWNANHRPDCRLVARSDDKVLGWAVLSPVSQRIAYLGVAEESIYVAASARGTGVGKALLAALIKESEEAGVWSLQAGIFPENTASIAVHKSVGFREIGVQERKGSLDGVWRDVVLMERRSEVVGV
jgi:L-amino acid N-acyltransferase YncA